jgi:aryl-alcohol dehydrogenase-like predicted oxidoreductase
MAVSALSLGSWRTLERVPADTGVAIMRAAREEGISFFDDARYDDETGMLFGATSAQQVQANCAAISLAGRLGPADLAHLHRIGERS